MLAATFPLAGPLLLLNCSNTHPSNDIGQQQLQPETRDLIPGLRERNSFLFQKGLDKNNKQNRSSTARFLRLRDYARAKLRVTDFVCSA